MHHPIGNTNSAVRQSTREGNAAILSRDNLTERHNDGVFVNLEDNDEDVTPLTISPTPNGASTETPNATPNATPTATVNSIIPATNIQP